MQLKSSPVVMAHDLGSFGAFIDATGEMAEQRTHRFGGIVGELPQRGIFGQREWRQRGEWDH